MEMLVAKCHGEGGQEGSCSDLGTTLLGWIMLALPWEFWKEFCIIRGVININKYLFI